MIVLDICSYTCTYKNVLEYFVLSYIIKIFLTSSITDKKKKVWREDVTFNISSFSSSNSKFSIFFTVFQTTFLKNTFFTVFPASWTPCHLIFTNLCTWKNLFFMKNIARGLTNLAYIFEE